MIIVVAVAFLILMALVVFALFKADRAEKLIVQRDIELKAADKRVQQAQEQLASETERVHRDAQAAVTSAQRLIEQQRKEIAQEAERVRRHYESEARNVQINSDNQLKSVLAELQQLRKYEGVRDAEGDTKRILATALDESSKLRSEGEQLLQKTRTLANQERLAAIQNVKDIHDQADARLSQALRDSGRIAAEAEKRAQQIAGSAYTAMRDKELLEKAAIAMRNIIEGYGDRYLVPTHSLLDDLAAEYSYDAAAQSLASAREQSRRMIEEQLAAECDYVEDARRHSAMQFVVHAFNGTVDSILSRTKSDNYGVLEQKIKDCYSIVNRDGSAFRNARILPAYLDARLAELKWAVVVQQLAQRDREEQRFQRERLRDEQKAEQEQLEKIRKIEKEEEIVRLKMEEALRQSASEQIIQNLREQLDAFGHKKTIAQQTVKGRIYVISNIGAFGDGVFKIGLTRRSAEERVDELSSASVPFEFDIHAVIETENALELERKLHHRLLETRMNKINLRKEFFRVKLSQIQEIVEKLEHGTDFHGTVNWTEKARAEHYYETMNIDTNPESREKWLTRAQQMAERRKKLGLRLAATEISQVMEDGQFALQNGHV